MKKSLQYMFNQLNLGLKFGTLSNISAHVIKGLEKKELDKRRRWRE